jgi:cytochrome c oxidase cbb3-type subunit III
MRSKIRFWTRAMKQKNNAAKSYTMTSNKNDWTDTDQEFSDEPETDIESHEYDGIKELDNPPPRWIMAIFYLTIGVSILYGAYFFWLKVGDKQDTEYIKSVQKAEILYQSKKPAVALPLLTDAASLATGKEIFMVMNCLTCHGQHGEGNAIGPNLTDNYWIHGCKFEQIFNTIKNGYPVKGMTAFKAQLSDEKIQQVSSYVLSLKGTNPANPKAPQGEPCQ